MALINVPLGDDIKDSPPAPEGEYDLKVLKVDSRRNKDDTRDMIVVTLQIESDEDYALLSEYLSIPHDEDDAKSSKLMSLRIKKFLTAFGIEFSDDGFDPEDLEGAEARLPLRKRELPPRKDEDGNVIDENEEPTIINEIRYPRMES